MSETIKFEKVSFEQFRKSVLDNSYYFDEKEIRECYDRIELPQRATFGAAGYDFKLPFDIMMVKGEPLTIPTGIRAVMPYNMVLLLMPRSGLGFKHGLKLMNTVGVIDSDYADSDNEGHIMAKITHTIGDYRIQLKQYDRFLQGIFTPYYTTENDSVSVARNGGFGSTGE